MGRRQSNFELFRVVAMIVLFGAVASMVFGAWLNSRMPDRNMIYYWVFPDAKVLAFGVAFCAFMIFKSLQIGSSRIVNAVGGATFGIYLLHDGALGAFRERVWGFLINGENYGGADFDKIQHCRCRRVRYLCDG